MHHLIIACGGTGTRIAAGVVEQFQDELGELPANVAIAVIDARHRPEVQLGNRNVFMVNRSQPINFAVEHQKLMNSRDRRSLVKDWWPPHVAPDAGVNFMDGCGAKRTNGRFFATYCDADIAAAIENALRRLMAIEGATGQQPDINVYVCASLGNGTGSGVFMQVAIIANDIVSASGLIPKINGFFVPSTTTAPSVRAGSDRIAVPRVGANGVAALIELQYEFNRQGRFQARAGGWTRHPRRGKGPLTHVGGHRTYECLSGPDVPAPFSWCFLVDAQSATGHLRTYDQVVDVASRSLFTLVSGADADYRLLDVLVLAPAPFGSVGFMRLRAPMKEGREYMTLRLRQELAHRLRQPDPDARHPHLSLWIGNHAPCDGTIAASVPYFVQRIAEIEETDATDQLLDRIRAVLPLDPAAAGELGTPTEPAHMDQFRAGIDSHLGACRAAVETFIEGILNGRGAVPTETELDRLTPEARQAQEQAMGFRALLRRKVIEPLVDAGEFGLLLRWSEALKAAITACRLSVSRIEHNRVQQTGSRADGAIDQYIAQAQESADHLLSYFSAGKRRDLLQTAATMLRQYMSDGRALIAAEAALRIYRTIENDLDRLANVLREARDGVASALFDSRIQHQLEGATGALETDRAGDKRAELVLGGRSEIELAIAESLAASADSGHGVAAAMAELAARHRAIIAHIASRIGASNLVHLPVGAPPVSVGWMGTYAADLVATLERRTNDVLVRHLSLTELLEARCSRLVDEYLEVGLPARHAGIVSLDRLAQERTSEMRSLVGDQFEEMNEELLAAYDPQRRSVTEQARDSAIRRALGAELRRLAGKAVVCWKRNPGLDDPITKHTALRLRKPRGGRLSQVLTDFASERNFHINGRDTNDPTRIDILAVEVGAFLENLTQSLVDPHEQHYEDCLDPSSSLGSGFSPHTSIEYLEAGRSFLAFLTGDQDLIGGGACLLALASAEYPEQPAVLRYVTENDGTFSVAREILVSGMVVASAGRKLDGKGIAAVTAALDLQSYEPGDSVRLEAAEALREGLADCLWSDIHALIFGCAERPEIKPVGLAKVCTWLSQQAAQIEVAAGEGGEDVAQTAALRRQASELRSLATTLRTSRGEERPALLMA
jgi:hypothetical protein